MLAQIKTTAAPQGLTLSAPGGGRPQLLLAEDSDPVRIVTSAMLKGMGCDVVPAVHGEEAVRLAAARRYDVIVLDIEMPIMDGITAARSIRRMGGACSATPLMALSAFLADAMQQASWSETFDIALPKPANRNELHAAMQAALNFVPSTELAECIAGEPLIDSQRLHEVRRGIAPEVWAELTLIANRDIETCVAMVEVLSQSGDGAGLAAHAFKLHALGRTFAAPRLAYIARRLGAATSHREIAALVAALIEVGRLTMPALTAAG